MVYIPGITKTRYRRKGGGGKGGGGKGGGGKGGGGKGGGGTGGGSGKQTRNNYNGLPTGKTSATTYGKGGGPVSTIQSGLFTGRTVGGGTRADVFGNRFVRAIFCHPMNFISSAMKR
jgi:hypothetical protein